jgi:hypothetical protein
VFVAALLGTGLVEQPVFAQSLNRFGTEFHAVRSVTVASGRSYSAVVTEFFHHGEIRPDGKNVVVATQNRLVPMQVLQLGPGDYCRLAFQPVSGHSEYDILYGGEPTTEKSPEWTARDGLFLETRKFTSCDFSNLDSVRSAFEKSERIGAGYVEGVFQSYNPFSLENEPFLSHYSGVMRLSKAAKYGFVVSSQDCSFLLVDGKVVASAPGTHGPAYQIKPGDRRDVSLSAGEHKFDYYHATAGGSAMMVAAWEIDPTDEKAQHVTAIPPEVFAAHAVAQLPATRLATRNARMAPDFVVRILNDVPLPDNDVPLIGVVFRDCSATALTTQGAKLEWDFGDGQTSSFPNADHVYLRPGTYTVKLTVRRGQKSVETVNRVYVNRPRLTPKDKLFTFDDYRKIIATYNPKTLDTLSLLQMVDVFETKAEHLTAQEEERAKKALEAAQDPNRRPTAKKDVAPPRKGEGLSDAERYLVDAVTFGKAAFLEDSAAKGDADLAKLARRIGPMARERLGDSETAYTIWRGAAQRIKSKDERIECIVNAVDIAINDLMKHDEAKKMLAVATKLCGKNERGTVASGLQRVWGDYYAATGDGKAARNAYTEAQRVIGFSQPLVQNTATRGAHARSAEEFIRQKEFGRRVFDLVVRQILGGSR